MKCALPDRATIIPWQSTSSCAIWTRGTFLSCHPLSIRPLHDNYKPEGGSRTSLPHKWLEAVKITKTHICDVNRIMWNTIFIILFENFIHTLVRYARTLLYIKECFGLFWFFFYLSYNGTNLLIHCFFPTYFSSRRTFTWSCFWCCFLPHVTPFCCKVHWPAQSFGTGKTFLGKLQWTS